MSSLNSQTIGAKATRFQSASPSFAILALVSSRNRKTAPVQSFVGVVASSS
jgi:hypothetical protein